MSQDIGNPRHGKLVARYRDGGEAAFEPRSRRPKSTPNTTPAKTGDLIHSLRRKLATVGLDAGRDTICWHLRQHHPVTVSKATIARHLAKPRSTEWLGRSGIGCQLLIDARRAGLVV